MRSPNINAQIIQQQRLVRFKDLYSFIFKAHPTLTSEITRAYVNTMRWYYASNFTRYLQALEHVKVFPSDRNEVLGGDPSAQRAGRKLPSSVYQLANKLREHGPGQPSWLCVPRPILSRTKD